MKRGQGSSFYNRVEFDRLVPTLENAIYRIAQEGLTNAYRHSKSERFGSASSSMVTGFVSRFTIGAWGLTQRQSPGKPFWVGRHPATGQVAGREMQHPKCDGQGNPYHR